jgi:hypothetical protein
MKYLPIYSSDTNLSFEQIFNLKDTSIELDWFGQTPQAKSAFVLARDPEKLIFAAKCLQKPYYDKNHCIGDFAAGLWEKDVAEIFIKEDNSTGYQEFNLSPSGAWWSGIFSDYRKEKTDTPLKTDGIRTYSEISETQWKAALEIPVNSLSIKTNLDQSTHVNVTFIIGGENRQYLSYAEILSPEPDFHKLDDIFTLKYV